MSDTTPRVALPLLAAAQSQKHVTHNEALLELDALISTTILDRDLSAPPPTPSDGDTYLVKATGTGAWAGQDGKLAYAIGGGWRFYAPFNGLVAYVSDESALIVYDGSAWVDYASILSLQNLPMLGVNATADSTNKLSVASAAVLFNNIGAGTQVKLNKATSGDTASLLMQNNFSGRAEIGLTGDDNFHFKVSPDGSTFYEALILNRNTGSQLLKHIDITAVTTLGAAHLGRFVRADASGGAFAVTLPATADADDWVIVRKKDTSANRITIKDNSGNDVAWLSAQYDEAMFAFWDGAWSPLRWKIAPLVDVFTASGTWTKPPLITGAEILCVGGGGGGGSGRQGAATSARAGGIGGTAGSVNLANVAASQLASTTTVTVGAGGAGGASQSSADSSGNSGAVGGASSFGSVLQANGGSAGAAGTTSAVTGPGTNGQTSTFVSPAAQGANSVTSTGTAPASSTGPTCGGIGGGISTANVVFDGTVSAAASRGAATIVNAASAGTSGGSGGAGNAVPSSVAPYYGGSGGGGGAASATAAAGAGGSGGAPGGGGGGGGASADGFSSGAGGSGARGEVRVTSKF
ncbi:MAG TPA: DUF2793 domain-containing protein [Rhizomicrobium sp.]|jgi:hypothetical protein